MARGWYHVTSRGNRRETIFQIDTDRLRFLGLVAVLPERFGLEMHTLVKELQRRLGERRQQKWRCAVTINALK